MTSERLGTVPRNFRHLGLAEGVHFTVKASRVHPALSLAGERNKCAYRRGLGVGRAIEERRGARRGGKKAGMEGAARKKIRIQHKLPAQLASAPGNPRRHPRIPRPRSRPRPRQSQRCFVWRRPHPQLPPRPATPCL